VPDAERFAATPWRAVADGRPVLDGALAALRCRRTAALPGGDHTVFVGEVEGAEVAEGEPLLYWRGAYRRLAP
jgi:flavin reductase (DIM6/NTAB) family NADH-FMN oxidoreductase RutF